MRPSATPNLPLSLYRHRFPASPRSDYPGSLERGPERLVEVGAEVPGVLETDAPLALMRELKCEYGQGYLFSHPVDADAAEELLAAGKQW